MLKQFSLLVFVNNMCSCQQVNGWSVLVILHGLSHENGWHQSVVKIRRLSHIVNTRPLNTLSVMPSLYYHQKLSTTSFSRNIWATQNRVWNTNFHLRSCNLCKSHIRVCFSYRGIRLASILDHCHPYIWIIAIVKA